MENHSHKGFGGRLKPLEKILESAQNAAKASGEGAARHLKPGYCFQNAAEAFGKGARPNPNPLQPAQRESKKAPGGKGPVAQWLKRRSSRLKIVSSNCGGGLFCATSGVCQYGQYVVFLVSFRLPFTITSRRKFPVLCAKKIGA